LHLGIQWGPAFSGYRLRVYDDETFQTYADVSGALDARGFTSRIVTGIPRWVCGRPLRLLVTVGTSYGTSDPSDPFIDYCGPMLGVSNNGTLIGDGFTPGGAVSVKSTTGTQVVTATNPGAQTMVSPGMTPKPPLGTGSTLTQLVSTPTPGQITTSLQACDVHPYFDEYETFTAIDLATNATAHDYTDCKIS
jgi:hypothetical protein